MSLGPPSLPAPGLILLGVLVAVAAVIDYRSHRIPNWLSLAGIAVGFAWNALSFGGRGLAQAALGLLTGFLLYFPLYLIRARGAGDVKLLAALGCIAGPVNCLWIFLLTAVGGGAVVLVIVIFRKRLRRTLSNVGWILYELIRFQMPYRNSARFDVRSGESFRVPHAGLLAVGCAAFIALAS